MYLPFLKDVKPDFAGEKHCSFFSKQLILRQILIPLYKKVNSKRDIRFGGCEKNSFFLFSITLVL
jgi:hypothetical protein